MSNTDNTGKEKELEKFLDWYIKSDFECGFDGTIWNGTNPYTYSEVVSQFLNPSHPIKSEQIEEKPSDAAEL